MCLANCTTIQEQLDASVSANSALLVSSYLETVVNALSALIPKAQDFPAFPAPSHATFILNMCKAVFVLREAGSASDGLVSVIPALVEVLQFVREGLSFESDLVERLTFHISMLQSELGTMAVSETETCPACEASIPFDDVCDAVCANGHAWSMCPDYKFITHFQNDAWSLLRQLLPPL